MNFIGVPYAILLRSLCRELLKQIILKVPCCRRLKYTREMLVKEPYGRPNCFTRAPACDDPAVLWRPGDLGLFQLSARPKYFRQLQGCPGDRRAADAVGIRDRRAAAAGRRAAVS